MTSASSSLASSFSSLSLPLPTYVRGWMRRAVLHARRDDVDLRRAQQLAHLGELALLVGPLREHGDQHGALGPCVVLDHLGVLAHLWSIRRGTRRGSPRPWRQASEHARDALDGLARGAPPATVSERRT